MMKTYVRVIVAMLAAAIVVLLGLASVSVVRIMSKPMTKAQAYGTMLTADRFDLQQPLVDVDDRQDFWMHLSAETTAQLRHADDAQWCSFLCVYGDPELQVPVALTHRLRIITPKTRHLSDRPPIDERAADLHVTGNGLRSSNRSSGLVTGTGWSGYGHYWLVQWKDSEGEWLAKPKVTYFTVASDRGDGIAEPRNLHVSSTGGGAVSIAWDPVEGAKRYGVYTIRADEAYDSWQQSKAFETEQTSVQLDGLDAVRSAEAVGVTAVDGDGNESYIRATTLRSLAGEPQDEPYTMSTWREVEDRKAEEAARAKNLAQPALVRPAMTRATGRPGAIDSKPIGENGVEQYKPFGSTEYARYIAENLLSMHTAIDITAYAASPSEPDVVDVIHEVIRQNPYLQVMAGADWSGIAVAQMDQKGKQVLKVRYGGEAERDRDEFHERVLQAAAAITAGPTREGAVQIDEYLARHASYDDAAAAALHSGAGFDELEAAHPDVWTGGVLTRGTGVDVSYALSYHAIARQVGLPAVTVTGWTSGTPHMWNRVFLEGQWCDIDPAWDDAGEQAVSTYQLHAANALDGHTVDSGWMSGAHIAAYGDWGSIADTRYAAPASDMRYIWPAGQTGHTREWPRLSSLPAMVALQIIWAEYLAFTIYFILALANGKGLTVLSGRMGRTIRFTPAQVFRTRMMYMVIAAIFFSYAIFKYGDMSNNRGLFGLAVVLLVPLLLAKWPGFFMRPDAGTRQ